MKSILLLMFIITSNSAYSKVESDLLDFEFYQTLTGSSLKLSILKRLQFNVKIRTEIPSDFSHGRFSINKLEVSGRAYLNPFGSTSASFKLNPEIFYLGEDICELKITTFTFNFKKFKSKLNSKYNRKILGALKVFDNYDPNGDKQSLVKTLNQKLQDFLTEDYCFNYQ